MKAGRFRPFPGLPVAESLRRWMFGIAWRLASRLLPDLTNRRNLNSPAEGQMAGPA
jgi:hypothetical protein